MHVHFPSQTFSVPDVPAPLPAVFLPAPQVPQVVIVERGSPEPFNSDPRPLLLAIAILCVGFLYLRNR